MFEERAQLRAWTLMSSCLLGAGLEVGPSFEMMPAGTPRRVANNGVKAEAPDPSSRGEQSVQRLRRARGVRETMPGQCRFGLDARGKGGHY